MDITLISFPKSHQIRRGKESIPVGLLYLSSYLRKNGVKCDFIDFSAVIPPNESVMVEDFVVDTLVSKLSNPPRLLGFSCFSSYQFPWINKISQRIKAIFPDIPICVGGSHPTFFDREILENCKSIDYTFAGEAEEELLGLTKIIIGESDKKLSDIQTLGYRDENGKVIINPRREFINNLDINPKELWGELEFEKYYSDHSFWNNPKNQEIKLAVPIISTRSCPFTCTFCSASKIMGRQLRRRSPSNVVDEIEFLNKERGQNYFEFIDDNINVNNEHAMQLFSEIINRKLDIQFSLSSGIYISAANEALVRAMADAGLAMIKLPIEHGNDYIRNKVIGKHLDKKDIYKIAKALKQYDVFVFGLLIMGFPEDTVETLDDSYSLMCELELDMYEMASLIPFPGTKLFHQCVRDNLLLSNMTNEDSWKGLVHFDASEHDKFYIKPYNMTIEDLKEYRSKFDEIRFYSKRAKDGQK